MYRVLFLSLWITGCCDDLFTYNSNLKVVEPASPDDGILTRRLHVENDPRGDWGYGIILRMRGPHAPNTKAFSVITTDSAGNEIDGFRIWGDARGESYLPFTFHAPLQVKEIQAVGKEVRWPDSVFAPNYSLMPLSELEAYVRAHRHLPGVPSQEEIAQRGLSLVQNQAVLLHKVEELTLYVISLQKQVDSLKALLLTRK
ncbi:MAG: hypothetical protein RMJ66_07905 [Bacteroidia bacterium]|nr:hypothetical protein [Bacteroidia bacterium]MDW8134970.1 hypothetical protein [Bacteroidia bacterium]